MGERLRPVDHPVALVAAVDVGDEDVVHEALEPADALAHVELQIPEGSADESVDDGLFGGCQTDRAVSTGTAPIGSSVSSSAGDRVRAIAGRQEERAGEHPRRAEHRRVLEQSVVARLEEQPSVRRSGERRVGHRVAVLIGRHRAQLPRLPVLGAVGHERLVGVVPLHGEEVHAAQAVDDVGPLKGPTE